ncbi:MAG TPA: hypothetical protein VIO32_05880 [Candidatus Baltobacteraceae bacterium]
MKHERMRGTALPETALTIGLALLLVLGAAQMALIGYTQVSADGAAFVAAHTQAQNPSANGVSAATGVFNNFNSSNFSTPSPSPSLVPYSVSKTMSGFSLMPGLASTYSVTGKDVEYSPANAGATPSPYEFSIPTETLKNYCDYKGNCNSNYVMYLAQGVNNGNGNGVNGTFSEWQCHQQYYAKVNWPANGRPSWASIQGSKLDPTQNNSVENNIYSWDAGTNKCN